MCGALCVCVCVFFRVVCLSVYLLFLIDYSSVYKKEEEIIFCVAHSINQKTKNTEKKNANIWRNRFNGSHSVVEIDGVVVFYKANVDCIETCLLSFLGLP